MSLEAVQERILAACARAGRDPAEVTLVAVTKGHSAAEIEQQLVRHGVHDLGENRMQEWREKSEQLDASLRWHFIGHLQRNKARLATGFALLHGVDSWRLIESLSIEGVRIGRDIPLLLQVNVSGEESKYGFEPAAVAEVAARMNDLPGVSLQGLMTMAPYDENPERARPHFRALAKLANAHAQGRTSMGMSGDFEVAIEEGANWVRIGGALFTPST